MKMTVQAALGAALLVFAGGAAVADPYVDYTPQKGVWEINAIEVDPNHMDDYLAGLRRSQVPAFEVMKSRGIIDDYRFVVRNGYSKGSPNVLIMSHHSTMAVLDPDKTRDQAIDKQIEAGFSKDAGKAAVAGYEKYRTFVDNGLWSDVVIAK